MTSVILQKKLNSGIDETFFAVTFELDQEDHIYYF